MNNGFILVATKTKGYFEKAVYCAGTIVDHWPDAKITLFTTPELHNPAFDYLFDSVRTDTPDERRGKLWACANTPYDLTFYLDADTAVEHEDIQKAFDQLNGNDIVFTACTDDRAYAYNHSDGDPRKFPGGEMEHHGGVFLYNRKAILFMKRWYELHKQQVQGNWWPKPINDYPIRLRPWDQFTLWWILNKEAENFKYLKVGFFENDARWNYLDLYTKALDHTNGEPRIIWHYNPVEMDQ